MINYQFYPKSKAVPEHIQRVIEVFKKQSDLINSDNFDLDSNTVLRIVRQDLQSMDFNIESSKSREGKIKVPVLFGRNGKLDKYFDADGYSETLKTVIEVEAGRAYANNQFLKDLFQASVMYDVEYLIITVRNKYKRTPDFEKINAFMETLYISNRLKLPLEGVLILGY